MTEQLYTSANTSINKTKLPAIYNAFKFNPGSVVLDYGCGKYINHIRNKMYENGCTWYGYDKYNQSDEFNQVAELLMEHKDYFDVGVCSNVLNVIDSIDVIKSIIKDIKDCCKTAVFFIYEGNGSGNGSVSKKDCWQRNEKVSQYAELMSGMGYVPTVKGKMIVLNDAA